MLERKKEKETVRICIDIATDETDVVTDEASSARKKERERNSEELHR
jgi:hypothetical protein